MDDVNCEPGYLLAIVNTGSNLNMFVTPIRPTPFILEGFDIELCTGTMIMVKARGGVEGSKMPDFDFSICYRAGQNEPNAKKGRLI